MTARSFTEAFAAEPLDLDALAELEAAATPGPWRADTAQRGDCVVWGPNRDEFLSNIGHVIVPIPMPEDNIISFDAEEHNTRLIAAARTALPSLIEAARDRERAIRWAVTLEGQLAAIEKLCDAADNPFPPRVTVDGWRVPGVVGTTAIRAALTGSTE